MLKSTTRLRRTYQGWAFDNRFSFFHTPGGKLILEEPMKSSPMSQIMYSLYTMDYGVRTHLLLVVDGRHRDDGGIHVWKKL